MRSVDAMAASFQPAAAFCSQAVHSWTAYLTATCLCRDDLRQDGLAPTRLGQDNLGKDGLQRSQGSQSDSSSPCTSLANAGGFKNGPRHSTGDDVPCGQHPEHSPAYHIRAGLSHGKLAKEDLSWEGHPKQPPSKDDLTTHSFNKDSHSKLVPLTDWSGKAVPAKDLASGTELKKKRVSDLRRHSVDGIIPCGTLSIMDRPHHLDRYCNPMAASDLLNLTGTAT